MKTTTSTGEPARQGADILGVFIDALNWNDVLQRIMEWARSATSAYICICNVHLVVTASKDSDYNRIINASDLALPDGMPVAWMLQRSGFPGQTRISGPDLMPALCQRCAEEGLPVYLYGSLDSTLDALARNLNDAFPQLLIAGMESPPFRMLTPTEQRETSERINASGARIIFVALGCPKQERWMAEHHGSIDAVMIGVGAAFDFHAGTIKRAPKWMRKIGLEWLHRLASEPRRLWKRYLVTNTLFIVGMIRQLGSR